MSSPNQVPSSGRPADGLWQTWGSYIAQPVAAAASIANPLVFRDLMAKSDQQRGLPIKNHSYRTIVCEGIKSTPSVGCLVGGQMLFQGYIEKKVCKGEEPGFVEKLESSAITGAVSSPIVAVFNGKTMGQSLGETMRKFTPKQAGIITAQETAFVVGISASDTIAEPIKQVLGDNNLVKYGVAYVSGAAGSFAGHWANTILTRMQKGLPVENFSQCWWGVARKTRALGLFAVGYKFVSEQLSPK